MAQTLIRQTRSVAAPAAQTSTKFCTACGKPVLESAKFCPECGAKQ